MTGTQKPPMLRYDLQAYKFVRSALPYAQKQLGRATRAGMSDENAHVTGPELLDGIRKLGCEQFGMLAKLVFNHWGVRETEDFGKIVFDLIDLQEMRKTEQDQLSDFVGVYDFDDVFDRQYHVDISAAFRGKLSVDTAKTC